MYILFIKVKVGQKFVDRDGTGYTKKSATSCTDTMGYNHSFEINQLVFV